MHHTLVNLAAATKTARARLATLGRVTRCEVRDAGGWYVVDAQVARCGRVTECHAVAPTLDGALNRLGC
jgi:hypothetical protein